MVSCFADATANMFFVVPKVQSMISKDKSW